MKNVIIILVLFTQLAFSQNIKHHNPDQDFKIGETYYLYGDKIKFRTTPDVHAQHSKILPIGTPLRVLKKTEVTLPYYGITSHFYKVAYYDLEGYILGAFLSLEKQQTDAGDFYFAYKKSGDTYILSTRLVNKKHEVLQKDVRLDTPSISLTLSNNLGLQNIDQIVHINYLTEACDANRGGQYLFLQKNTLYHALAFTKVADGGDYWLQEEIIFPNDPRGIAGKLLYQKEMGTYKDQDSNWWEVTKVSRELEWKSGEIFPKLN